MRKIVLTTVALVLIAALPVPSPGTVPVLDYSNLIQTTTTALKQVAAYAEQVQQYQTQILQYKNQLLNTLGIAPALQVWQQSQAVMNQLTGLAGSFSNGNIQSAISQFQNVNYWLSTPINSYGYQTYGSGLQKQANDAQMEGLVKETQQIQADAATLQRLETTASGAQGQMQALTAANQLAAMEESQLLQIRALLVQEQQAMVARNATLSNGEGQQQAATQEMYGTVVGPQNATGWKP